MLTLEHQYTFNTKLRTDQEIIRNNDNLPGTHKIKKLSPYTIRLQNIGNRKIQFLSYRGTTSTTDSYPNSCHIIHHGYLTNE